MPAEGDFTHQATHCRVAFRFHGELLSGTQCSRRMRLFDVFRRTAHALPTLRVGGALGGVLHLYLRGMMRAVIFANGDAPDPNSVRHWAAQADLIIAADGGTRHALSAGVLPQVVIGDLDSLADADREQLDRSGVPLIVYPTHKDYTDLELAVRYARRQQRDGDHHLQRAGRKVGSIAGKFDAAGSAGTGARSSPHGRSRPVRFKVIRDRAEIAGRVGDTLSLIALRGDAHGVTIEGCEYPLSEAALPLGATLGISNVFAQPAAKITVRQGLDSRAAHQARRMNEGGCR